MSSFSAPHIPSRKSLEIASTIDALTTSALPSRIDKVTLRPGQESLFAAVSTWLRTGAPNAVIKGPTGFGKGILAACMPGCGFERVLYVGPTKITCIEQEEKVRTFVSSFTPGIFWGGKRSNLDSPFTLTTAHSLIAHVAKGRIRPGDYDLILLDEGQLMLTELRQGTLRALAHPDTRFLALTAVPGLGVNKSLYAQFGPPIYDLTLPEARAMKLIAPGRAHLLETGIDLSNIRIRANQEYDAVALEAALNNDTLNAAVTRIHADFYPDKKAYYSTVGVRHARRLAARLNDEGMPAAALSCEDSAGATRDKLKAFRDGALRALCSDSMLFIGRHDASARVLFNLRPTFSRHFAEQRIGRMLSLDETDPGKESLIIDCIHSDPRRQERQIVASDVLGETSLLGETSENRASWIARRDAPIEIDTARYHTNARSISAVLSRHDPASAMNECNEQARRVQELLCRQAGLVFSIPEGFELLCENANARRTAILEELGFGPFIDPKARTDGWREQAPLSRLSDAWLEHGARFARLGEISEIARRLDEDPEHAAPGTPARRELRELRAKLDPVIRNDLYPALDRYLLTLVPNDQQDLTVEAIIGVRKMVDGGSLFERFRRASSAVRLAVEEAREQVETKLGLPPRGELAWRFPKQSRELEAELRRLREEATKLGIPIGRSGQFSQIFQFVYDSIPRADRGDHRSIARTYSLYLLWGRERTAGSLRGDPADTGMTTDRAERHGIAVSESVSKFLDAVLPPVSSAVLKYLYGLDAASHPTYKAAAHYLGVSGDAVRRAERKAIELASEQIERFESLRSTSAAERAEATSVSRNPLVAAPLTSIMDERLLDDRVTSGRINRLGYETVRVTKPIAARFMRDISDFLEQQGSDPAAIEEQLSAIDPLLPPSHHTRHARNVLMQVEARLDGNAKKEFQAAAFRALSGYFEPGAVLVLQSRLGFERRALGLG